jgi:hypothetical protein
MQATLACGCVGPAGKRKRLRSSPGGGGHNHGIPLLQYFRTHPCVDCGERDPVVLEFDHLGEKSFNIGQALPYRNWQSILAEI